MESRVQNGVFPATRLFSIGYCFKAALNGFVLTRFCAKVVQTAPVWTTFGPQRPKRGPFDRLLPDSGLTCSRLDHFCSTAVQTAPVCPTLAQQRPKRLASGPLWDQSRPNCFRIPCCGVPTTVLWSAVTRHRFPQATCRRRGTGRSAGSQAGLTSCASGTGSSAIECQCSSTATSRLRKAARTRRIPKCHRGEGNRLARRQPPLTAMARRGRSGLSFRARPGQSPERASRAT